jgi:two-component system cell cycle response regulator DivK
MIDLMRNQLEFLGYEVIVAVDGLEATEKAASDLPDLIVMDILMPKLDGFEATKLIRKEPKTKNIPILAATAKALPGDKEKCLEAGCDAYIAKPFTHRQLETAIASMIKKRTGNFQRTGS